MSDTTLKKPRPKHLDLKTIRLPLPGFVSILHRVSGVGLFLMMPVLLWLFGASVGGPEAVAQAKSVLGNPLVKLVLFGLLWAYLHHFCAGIRFLMLDIHKGLDLPTARKTAGAVLVVSLTLTLLIGAKIFLG
ncbi:succinate dehydrogenase, cytochrome b556 subunit [Niveibacterium sp. 24ML]|uniref:succinate dehydrogenase, cytochrome b556 subunit n=1 Tax=Niveibacterium sp. 24ML TaxID=2985512 RepID=UPI00226E676A|nr:succinate dehydrogenase, cytochrome b556 subunit [Niveibacterium sp. 24ML]MCX9157252.1 succinate dehydrogenase, cytochrome b556 subunit [Niveibacterium sp. 24ML]